MKKFVIDKNSSGIRLDKFMTKVMQNQPYSLICKSLRKKKVKVNGKHKSGECSLSLGDVIEMYINDELFSEKKTDFDFLKISSDIDVVYEDDNIIIVNKPSGMLSQNSGKETDSLESRVRSYLFKKGEINLSATGFLPALCHRIDRNTSGLVVAAKNMEALRILNEKIKNREIRKFYLCETEKAPDIEAGKICGYLTKNSDRKMVFSKTENKNSLYCETVYKTLKKGSPALVEAEILTGRTHQIRASMEFIGCPLLGDVKYGAKPDGKSTYQHLSAYKILFDFSSDGGSLEYLNKKEFSTIYIF